jgi:hypothetical protein
MPLKRCLRHNALNATIVHVRNTIGKTKNARIVCDNNQRSPLSKRHAAQQFHDALPGICVQGAGRLIADYQTRLMHERPGNRHALLLAPRKLRR